MTINVEKAKNIAKTYIEEPYAMAGTPEIKSVDDVLIYVVPVFLNNILVGEIHIDPENGKNIGGAGGALNG